MNGTNTWRFRAETAPGRLHTVTKLSEGCYTCSCPVFSYSKPHDCRHVRLVKSGLAGLPINDEPELAWATVEHVPAVSRQGAGALLP